MVGVGSGFCSRTGSLKLSLRVSVMPNEAGNGGMLGADGPDGDACELTPEFQCTAGASPESVPPPVMENEPPADWTIEPPAASVIDPPELRVSLPPAFMV